MIVVFISFGRTPGFVSSNMTVVIGTSSICFALQDKGEMARMLQHSFTFVSFISFASPARYTKILNREGKSAMHIQLGGGP